jgi:hypothetical protein
MTDEPSDDRPWGEEQWEQFLRESEARSARFGDLLETLMDHPDRDEILHREMGWDRKDDPETIEEDVETADLIAALNEPPSEEDLEEIRRQHDALEELPAYRRSFDWAMRVFEALKDEPGQLEGDLAELIGQTVCDAQMVAAKIAGAHGMGYEDESLCGNIVCCKRSLEAAKRSLQGLSELSDLHPPLSGPLAPLLREGQEIEQLVADHIAELRSRVWWE